GAGGVLDTFVTGQGAGGDGIPLLSAALGVALLGGTSAFGRRGGIFGTIFAATLFVLVLDYATALHRTGWPVVAYGAIAIGLGLEGDGPGRGRHPPRRAVRPAVAAAGRRERGGLGAAGACALDPGHAQLAADADPDPSWRLVGLR